MTVYKVYTTVLKIKRLFKKFKMCHGIKRVLEINKTVYPLCVVN